jgi:hypothetical protein
MVWREEEEEEEVPRRLQQLPKTSKKEEEEIRQMAFEEAAVAEVQDVEGPLLHSAVRRNPCVAERVRGRGREGSMCSDNDCRMQIDMP